MVKYSMYRMVNKYLRCIWLSVSLGYHVSSLGQLGGAKIGADCVDWSNAVVIDLLIFLLLDTSLQYTSLQWGRDCLPECLHIFDRFKNKYYSFKQQFNVFD